MMERPLWQQIEFAKRDLEFSERAAAQENPPGFFTQQAARVRKEIEDLEVQAGYRRASDGARLPRRGTRFNGWKIGEESYTDYLERRADDPNITRERRRQIKMKIKRILAAKRKAKHDKGKGRNVRR
jgi:hypothetical protein